jgi:hypothetical protein
VRPCGLSDDLVRLMAAYWNSTDEGERVRALDKYGAGRLFAGYPRRTVTASRPRTCRGIALRNSSSALPPAELHSHDEPHLHAKVEDAHARIAENALIGAATTRGSPTRSWAPATPGGGADGARVRRRVRRRDRLRSGLPEPEHVRRADVGLRVSRPGAGAGAVRAWLQLSLELCSTITSDHRRPRHRALQVSAHQSGNLIRTESPRRWPAGL